MKPEIIRVPTKPFEGQRPGTSGLRKKTRVFMQPNYLENAVQSVFNVIRETAGDFGQHMLVIGGDGRYYNREAIKIIINMAVANGFGKLLVARGGLMLTAETAGGIDEDFGI